MADERVVVDGAEADEVSESDLGSIPLRTVTGRLRSSASTVPARAARRVEAGAFATNCASSSAYVAGRHVYSQPAAVHVPY
jgi:hypothetical protein